MTNTKIIFSKRLRALRKKQKFTQEKLAEILDIDQRHVVRLESGEGLPSVETLLKLASALNTTPDFLIGFDCEKNEMKSDIFNILALANSEQLELIKKLILAVL